MPAHLLLLLCAMLALPAAARAEGDEDGVIRVALADIDVSLAGGIGLLADPGGQLTIADMADLGDVDFTRLPGNTASLGFASGAHWFRLTLASEIAERTDWVLANAWALTEHFTAYIPAGRSGYRVVERGLASGDGASGCGQRRQTVPLTLEPYGKLTVFIRIAGDGPRVADFTLQRPAAFARQDNLANLQMGLLYGCLLALVLCNLLLFFAVRHRTYLYYILFAGSYWLYHLHFFGFLPEILRPESSDMHLLRTVWFAMLTLSLGVYFTRGALGLGNHPRLDRAAWLSLVPVAGGGIWAFFDLSAGHLASTVVAVGIFAGCVVLGTYVLARGGGRAARYYLGAWCVMCVGGILFALVVLGTLEPTALTLHIFHVGAGTGGLVISFALGSRIAALHQSLERRLEKDLRERTALLRDNLSRLDGEVAVRRQTELRLEATHSELSKANEELAGFARAASRDLREPLRHTSHHVQMLRDLYLVGLDEKLGKFIHFASDGAERMRLLIDGLLAYSEVHSSGERFGPVDCQRVLEVCLGNLSGAISARGADVTSGRLPVVWGDHEQLGQLFQNLVANGVKFCKPEERPAVQVSAEKQNGWWLFSIDDNGIGVDERFKDRIFAIFQRLHTRSEYPGTGLGLALCRKIVDRHGGEVWLEKSSPAGSRFCFTLPASSSTSSSSSSSAGALADRPESCE